MPKLLLLGLLLTCLAACETAPSDVTCPSLPVYNPEVQKQAADELDTLPDGSVLANILVPDYRVMRAGVRACIQARGK